MGLVMTSTLSGAPGSLYNPGSNGLATKTASRNPSGAVLAGMVIFLGLPGCGVDNWVFRSRDASSALADTTLTSDDRSIHDDTAAVDSSSADSGERFDVSADDMLDSGPPATDVLLPLDAVMEDDVVLGIDRPLADAYLEDDSSSLDDRGTIPTTDTSTPNDRPSVPGLHLQQAGFATGTLPGSSGSLRLRTAGFEFGQRTCAGNLCTSGAFFR